MWCLIKIPVRLGGHAVRFPGDLRRVRNGAQRRTVSKLLPVAAAIVSAVSPAKCAPSRGQARTSAWVSKREVAARDDNVCFTPETGLGSRIYDYSYCLIWVVPGEIDV